MLMPDSILRIGSFLAPAMLPVYRAIAHHLGERLGCKAHIEIGRSYRQAWEDFDVCFICGLAYIEIVQRYPVSIEPSVAPILQGDRYRGRPIYFSDVIVKRDSPFDSFEDLRGGSWCFNEPWSQSGYGITRYWLTRLQENASFFGRVIQSGWHERSIEMVCAEEIDASAIDSHVLSLALRRDPGLRSEIRIIETLGPSTIQPLTVAHHLPTSLKQEIQHVLLEISSDASMRKILAKGLIERFAPVDDSSYDDLRDMRSSCTSMAEWTPGDPLLT